MVLHQEQLRRPVAVHVAVVVEVVLGEVRERGHREPAAVDAPEVEPVRRHLHHGGVDPLRAHTAQRALEIEALGRRVARALAHVAVAHLDRADQPDRAAGRREDRLGEIGVEVLPFVPVTPTSASSWLGSPKKRAAIGASARRESRTTTAHAAPRSNGSGSSSTTSAAAPSSSALRR